MVRRHVLGNESDGFLRVREIAVAPSVAGVREQHVELELWRVHATLIASEVSRCEHPSGLSRPADATARLPKRATVAPTGLFQGTR